MSTSQLDVASYQYQILVNKNQKYALGAPHGDEVQVVSTNSNSATINWFLLPVTSATGQFNIFLNDGSFSYNSRSGVIDKGNFLHYNETSGVVSLRAYPDTNLYPWVTEVPATGAPFNWGAPSGKNTVACLATAKGYLLFPNAYKDSESNSNPSGALYVDSTGDFETTQDFTQWSLVSSTV